MVTFSVEIGKPQKDGSRAIYIRVRKDRVIKRIRFLDANKEDVSPKGEIINDELDMIVSEAITNYRRRLYSASTAAKDWDVERIVEYITADDVPQESFKLDFFQFGEDMIKKMIKEDREGSARLYVTTLNNFEKFVGSRSIDINEINKPMLLRYMEWLKDNNYGDRAIELYMGNLQAIHNRAKLVYNDEEDDKLNIPKSPFKTIQFKRPAAKKSEIVKRALSATALRYLYAVPVSTLTDRAAMARDAFFLSFALCGMNAKDMWLHKMAEDIPEDLIEYYRQKTVGRTGKDAFISVHVHPFVMELHRRRRSTRKTWVFGRYSTPQTLNEALTDGLNAWVDQAIKFYGELWGLDPDSQKKRIVKKMELPDDGHITFYSARHSFATIAANDCGVSTDIIDRCLCHSINSVAAKSYIKKDYRFTDETVAKVMKFVFNA